MTQDQARQIGRGGIYLTLTKLYFILFSYVIYFGLPKVGEMIGKEGLFGDYKAVNALLSVISTVLVTGTMQAVSRFVGRDVRGARAVKRTAVRLQAGLGLVVAAAFFLVAPLVTKDESLVVPLRVAAGIPLIYAVYAVFMGTLNGEKRFGEQAFLDAAFTTSKVLLVLVGAFLLGSVAGAFAGFLAAAVLVLIGGIVITRRRHVVQSGAVHRSPGTKEIFLFQVQTVGWMLAVQWLVQMDLWYVQWFSAQPQDAMSAIRGLYGSAQLFSQISYSLVVAVTFVLFPLVSASNLSQRPEEVRAYVREALRYALLMVVGVSAILSSTPEASAGLLQSLEKVVTDGVGIGQIESMRYLGLGYVFFSLFFILCSVLNAGGLPRHSVALTLLVVGIQLGLGVLLVPRFDLVGQGVAGLVAMATGFTAVTLLLWRRIGPFLPWASICRILLAGAVVYAVALAWHPEGKLMTVVRFAVEGVLFLGIVVVSGEFKAEDRARFKKVLGRGKKT